MVLLPTSARKKLQTCKPIQTLLRLNQTALLVLTQIKPVRHGVLTVLINASIRVTANTRTPILVKQSLRTSLTRVFCLRTQNSLGACAADLLQSQMVLAAMIATVTVLTLQEQLPVLPTVLQRLHNLCLFACCHALVPVLHLA